MKNNTISLTPTIVIVAAFIICLVCSVNGYAQNKGEDYNHLEFMGIPIDGNIDDFEQALFLKGLKINSKYYNSDGIRSYHGRFANITDAEITVFFEPRNNIVYTVHVKIPESFGNKLWERMVSKYSDTLFYAEGTWIGELENGEKAIIFPIDKNPVNLDNPLTYGNKIFLKHIGQKAWRALYLVYEDLYNTISHEVAEDNDL